MTTTILPSWLRVTRSAQGGWLREVNVLGVWTPAGTYASQASAIRGAR